MLKQFQLLRIGSKILKNSKMPFYAVAKGRNVGIYNTWSECEDQVKGFSGPKFKKFSTRKEAENFISPSSCSEIPTKSEIPNHSKKVANSESVSADWNDDDDLDEEQLLAIIEAAEGTTTSNKRKSKFTSSSSKRLKHQSIINESAGFKTYGKYEFPIDSEGYVIVYTDGSCENNGKKNSSAGLGVYFSDDHPLNTAKPVSGRATNNCGEVQAASEAIRLAKNCGITKLCISTDSQFLINSITRWIHSWKRNNWKLKSGDAVKNMIDFKELDNLVRDKQIDIKWNYVKGHEGILGNEKADELAKKGAQIYKQLHKN